MKSSTIRRSALSKESMGVIESLAGEEFVDYSQDIEQDNSPEEYLRPETEDKQNHNKTQEIDLLWQTFKSAQFNTNSPAIQIIGGVLLGMFISFLIVSAFLVYSANKAGNIVNSKQILINFGTEKSVDADLKLDGNIEQIQEENVSSEIVDKEEQTEQQNQQEEISQESSEPEVSYSAKGAKRYIIKEGDTVEGIIKKYYGAYTPERANAIMKANKLNNLDHISIGQELIIPVEK